MITYCLNRTNRLAILTLAIILGFTTPAWAALPIGWLDGIDFNGTASGWAQDPQGGITPPATVQVEFYLDGGAIPIATTTANIPRDVGAYGFRITLPESARAAGHQLHVWAVDFNSPAQRVELSGSPQSYNVSAADNATQHVFSGSLYQIGPSIGNIFGGRPLNKYGANEAKTLNSANWQASATLPWQSRGNSPISITVVPRMAGAISSIMWDNVEFIDSGGHGAAFQYILHGNHEGELYNPTEAGSKADDAVQWWHTSLVSFTENGAPSNFYSSGSSSELNYLSGGNGQPLHTLQRMAYWNPRVPNPATWPYVYSDCIDANGNGLRACDAFYTSSVPGTLATNLDLAAPAAGNELPWFYDNNNGAGQPNEINNPNILSPYYLEKTITTGAFSIGNVIKVEGKFTIPGSIPSSKVDDFQLVAYLDHVRFQRVFYYNLTTGAFDEKFPPFTEPAPSAMICTSLTSTNPNDERYAIGMYSSQISTEIYPAKLSAGSGHLLMGSGTANMGWSGPYQMDTYVVVGALVDVKNSLAQLYTNLGGLKAEYFRGVQDLSGTPYWTRKDATVNFVTTGRPSSGVDATNYSIRWTGTVTLPATTGKYTFYTNSDDGVRLYFDNVLKIDNWTNHAPTINSFSQTLTGGTQHTIRMEYHNNLTPATAQLMWAYPGQAQQVIPAERLTAAP